MDSLSLYPVGDYIGVVIESYLRHADISVYKMEIRLIHQWSAVFQRQIGKVVVSFLNASFGVGHGIVYGVYGSNHKSMLLLSALDMSCVRRKLVRASPRHTGRQCDVWPKADAIQIPPQTNIV